MSVPTGAEVTGPSLQFSGGRGYITWAIQHPQDWEGEKLPRDAQEVGGRKGFVLVYCGGGGSGAGGAGSRCCCADCVQQQAMRGYVGYLGPT
jgi:hypothetical protein